MIQCNIQNFQFLFTWSSSLHPSSVLLRSGRPWEVKGCGWLLPADQFLPYRAVLDFPKMVPGGTKDKEKDVGTIMILPTDLGSYSMLPFTFSGYMCEFLRRFPHWDFAGVIHEAREFLSLEFPSRWFRALSLSSSLAHRTHGTFLPCPCCSFLPLRLF